MAEKIRFAVIGCGLIGKRHAEMIQRNPQSELVALVDVRDRDDLGLDSFSAPFFPSLEDFIASGVAADVATIATPNGLHFAQAWAALSADMHVVVEKPLSLSSADAEKLISCAAERQKKIFPVMQNRYSPPSVWLKEIVRQNLLGRIYIVQVNCFWNRDERYYTPDSWHGAADLDGGTLFTQFSHFLDIMLWLFGGISDISAKFADFNHQNLTDFEDSGMVFFNIENGGMGSFNYSTSVWDRNLESSITIIAENGSVKIGGQYMDKVEICHIKDYEMPQLPPTNPSNTYLHYKGSAANHHFMLENVISVLSQGADITVEAKECRNMLRTIEDIYRQRDIKNLKNFGIYKK